MRHYPLTLKLLGSGCLFWLSGNLAFAAGETLGLDAVTQGTLLLKSEQPGRYQAAPTQQTDVEMLVTGPIVRTQVTQRFSNPGAQWAEAIYAFPLPEEAAVDRLAMRIGERLVQGVIMEKAQARQTYETARQQGKRSALVQQHRPNLFTTSVANIPPNGEIEVRIEYQDLVTWRDDRFSLRFPMAVTPRYRPRAPDKLVEEDIGLTSGWAVLPGEIPNAVPLDPDPDPESPLLNPVSMRVTLDAGLPLAEIASPTHEIRSEATGQGGVTVSFTRGEVAADRDFVLEWRPVAGQAPRAAFFTERTDAGDYALMLIMPPAANAPLAEIARELILVIDTSGSMGGASIRQARAALHTAIEQLTPGDTFNVIQFNSSSEALFGQSLPANSTNKRLALGYVDALKAHGGTEIRGALERAFALSPGDDQRLTQVLFVTDGAVSNEAELLAYINQSVGDRRLFTVGIGSAPNAHFMAEAALFGRGDHIYIGRIDEVRQKMEALLDRLEHPALTAIRLTLSNQADVLPDPMPDLYAGEPIVAVMRLSEDVVRIDIEGQLGNTLWRSGLTPTQTESEAPLRGLGVHWARQKIQHWMRALVRGGDPEQTRQQVLDLALRHHLVSQYTSLVAVDVTPARPQGEALGQHALDANLPAGWQPGSQTHAVQAADQLILAQGSTPSLLSLALGLVLTALAGLVARRPFKVAS